MLNQTMLARFNKPFYLLFIIILSSGCSTMLDKKTTPFDPRQVDTMDFQFENFSTLLNVTLPQSKMAKQTTSNLSQWGYSFNTEDFKHILAISIGAIKHDTTPAGFSFNIGNSNPRALEFQKADVLSLTCALMPKNQTAQRAEITMQVIADDYIKFANQPEQHAKFIDQLTDDISTTCFNLLSSLNIKTTKTQHSATSTVITPSWIPEIRVEVVNEPTTQAVKPIISNPDTNENNTESLETEAVKKPIATPRKRFIIHNKGNPVIFKFGHERK